MKITNDKNHNKDFYVFTICILALTVTIIGLLYKLSVVESEHSLLSEEHYIHEYNVLNHDDYMLLSLSSSDVYQINFYHGEVKNSIYVSTNIPMSEAEPLDLGEPTDLLYKVPSFISELGYELVEIAPVSGDGDYEVLSFETLNAPDFDEYEDYKVIDFEIKVFDISIDEDDYDLIKEKRLDAIKHSILLTSDEDYVKAKVYVDGEKFKSELRLKGDWTDHLISDKWSYRIKVSNDAIFGMSKISLHKPEARGHAGEAVLHDFYRSEGGVAPRYDFVDVVINGVYKGVYAMEESFDKRMVENADRREGVIIKEDETILWHNRIYYNLLNKVFPYKMPTTVFGESKVSKDDKLFNYGLYATHLYNSYESGELSLEEVFDVDQLVNYLSILDIFSTKHGFYEQNRRFYFNPISFKLEPITFDNDQVLVAYEGLFHIPEDEPFKSLYYDKLFSNANKIITYIDEHEEAISRYNYICDRDDSARFEPEYITDKVAYIEGIKGEVLNPSYKSFYVAGHIYGAHENEEYLGEVYPRFSSILEQFRYDQTLQFGVLTGDTVKTASEESFTRLLETFNITEKPIHIAIGNHDLNDGGDAFDLTINQEHYYAFVNSDNLFVILEPNKYTWDIDVDQLLFVKETLSTYSNVNNVFVFSHELFWKWKDDKHIDFEPNSYFQKEKASNFNAEVLPLFEELNKPVYFIAGDVGAFAGRKSYAMDNYGMIHYIASGMGGEQYENSSPANDNYLYIKMYDDGRVEIESRDIDD